MRKLRGLYQGRNVTLFLFLVLATASSLAFINSRSSYAESPSLLGTVRCAVRTVLLTDCPPVAPQAPASQGTPAPAQSNGTASQTPAQSNRQAPTTNEGNAQEAPVGSETLTTPDTTLASYQAIENIPHANSVGYAINDSNYLAYFNAYSPYARSDGNGVSTSAVVEASSDGWKVLGIAWYWWLVAAVLVAVIIASLRKIKLSKTSILSEGT